MACYKKCAKTSGDQLSRGEQQCTANCMDRYIECMNVVANKYMERAQKQQ